MDNQVSGQFTFLASMPNDQELSGAAAETMCPTTIEATANEERMKSDPR
jgi:hypothetical protein